LQPGTFRQWVACQEDTVGPPIREKSEGIKDATGGFALALGVLGAGLVVAAAVILLFGYVSSRSAATSRNNIQW